MSTDFRRKKRTAYLLESFGDNIVHTGSVVLIEPFIFQDLSDSFGKRIDSVAQATIVCQNDSAMTHVNCANPDSLEEGGHEADERIFTFEESSGGRRGF